MKDFDPFTTEITKIVREYFAEYQTENEQLRSHGFFNEYKERSFYFIISLLAALAMRPDMKVCFFFDSIFSSREKHIALFPSSEIGASMVFWDFVFMQGNIKINGRFFMKNGEHCGEWKL